MSQLWSWVCRLFVALWTMLTKRFSVRCEVAPTLHCEVTPKVGVPADGRDDENADATQPDAEEPERPVTAPAAGGGELPAAPHDAPLRVETPAAAEPAVSPASAAPHDTPSTADVPVADEPAAPRASSAPA